MSLAEAVVLDWLDAYKQAWENQDSELIVTLFSEDAQYIENPFHEPMVGRQAIRQYWQNGAVASQKEISFASQLWSLEGNVAIAHWSARLTRTRTETRAHLDGVFRLTFRTVAKGPPVCEKLQEWWFANSA